MRKLTLSGLFSSKDKAEREARDREFAKLFALHIDHVLNFCKMQLNDTELSEDITGEIFERAWKKRHTFDAAKGDFTPWIFQIARNRLVDEYRSRSKQITLPLDEELIDFEQLSPEAHMDKAELRERLLQSMKHLTDEEQTIIGLKFGAGLDNQAIAQITEKTPGAIASSVYRAMNKLRRLWAKEEQLDE